MSKLRQCVAFLCLLLWAWFSQAGADPLLDATQAYEEGEYATAAKLLMPLAEQGNAEAQFKLGLMYAEGQEVAQSYQEAAGWFQLAAVQGHVKAQYTLGTMYAKGQGVPQDDEHAARWYLKAAHQNHPAAQFAIAEMYHTGRGGAVNVKQAAMWYINAANNRVQKAQYTIGLMYANGAPGFARDYVQAYKWLSLTGDIAAESKQWVESKMTPEQIKQGQALIQDWLSQAR